MPGCRPGGAEADTLKRRGCIERLGEDMRLGAQAGDRPIIRDRTPTEIDDKASMTASLRLRPTMLSDLDFVLSVERDAANLPFITPWERMQHEGAVRFPDFRHFIVEAGEGTQATGFVILQGCRNPHGSVELKRLVLQTKGQGLGRACVRLLMRMAFRDLHAHRFWLDVKALNTRAKALYESEGFIIEGTLREAVRIDGGYDSLIVMSMLASEYAARNAATG